VSRWNRPDWVEDRPRCRHLRAIVLARDFAAVTLPAIIGIALTL
jgi:hypothetical protein